MKTLFSRSLPAAFALLLAACASSPRAPEPYPQSVRDDFMGSCSPDGELDDVCACALSRIEAKYTVSQVADGKIDEAWLKQVTTDCIGETSK